MHRQGPVSRLSRFVRGEEEAPVQLVALRPRATAFSLLAMASAVVLRPVLQPIAVAPQAKLELLRQLGYIR